MKWEYKEHFLPQIIFSIEWLGQQVQIYMLFQDSELKYTMISEILIHTSIPRRLGAHKLKTL